MKQVLGYCREVLRQVFRFYRDAEGDRTEPGEVFMAGGKTFLIGLTAVLAGIFSFSGPAMGAGSALLGADLQAALRTASPTEEIPVIVRMSDQLQVRRFAVSTRSRGPARRRARAALIQQLRQRAASSQKSLRDMLRQAGKTAPKSLWLINALALKADPALIAAIARSPGVASVALDAVIHAPSVLPAATTAPAAWNIEAVHAPDLWKLGFTGQGVVVATLDTGVDITSSDLKDKWRGGSDSWYDPYNGTTTPYDVPDPSITLANFGHGTAVMGVLLGGSADGTAIGVAPGARWIAAKIFDDNGNADLSKIHQAFQWVLDPDGDPNTDDAPDIVNNSWGLQLVGQCLTDPSLDNFQPDVQALEAAGIAVVFAAGNDGPDAATSNSPANYPQSISVGAVDQLDQVASFSSRGPAACGGGVYPTLAAPGVHIETDGLNGNSVVADGTSFSSPHVAGVMALLLSKGAFPKVSVSALEAALEGSATDLGTTGPDNDYGYGLVNALAAAKKLNHPPAAATLISPPDGAAALTVPVTLHWDHPVDPDGQAVTDAVFLSESADFSTPVAASTTGTPKALPAGLGAGFLFAGLLAGLDRRKRVALALLMVAAGCLLLVSCGGGGGGGGGATQTVSPLPPSGQVGSQILTNLAPATTYYWKVVSTDPFGATAASNVRSFTTK